MKLEKTSNLYERCEIISARLKETGNNWNAEASAAACLMTILNEIVDSGKTAEQLLDDDGQEESRAWRKRVKDVIKPMFTAPKNWQNSYLEPSGLMPKAVGEKNQDEFV